MSRVDEIRAVKQLGEKIGYGNMMDIASALWSIDLTSIDGKERFGHVATVLPCMKKFDQSGARVDIRNRRSEIETLLR